MLHVLPAPGDAEPFGRGQQTSGHGRVASRDSRLVPAVGAAPGDDDGVGVVIVAGQQCQQFRLALPQ